jgi:hypothetical protein
MKRFNQLILRLSLITFINLIVVIFTSDHFNSKKYDIYLFYDYLRWPENIAYDIVGLIVITLLICSIYKLVDHKIYRKYVGVFLIASILNIFGYFLFYSQYVSLFLAPYIILHLYCIWLFKVKKYKFFTQKKSQNE